MNPVLRKDLLSLLRLGRTVAIQLAFIGMLGLVVLMSWPQGGIMSGTIAFAEAARSAGAGGEDQLLFGLVLGQIVLLSLFVPGVSAVALTGEREANTLEMLYASRLSPGQIIAGKLGLAISYPLLLLSSGLPFVALMSWRGDVRSGDLLWSYLILLVAAIFMAMLALTVSALCRQSATALVLAYVLILALFGGTLVPAAILLESQSGWLAAALHYVRALSPVAAALSRLRPGLNDLGGQGHLLLPVWQVFLPLAAGVTLACVGVVAWKLGRAPASGEAMGAIGHTQAQQTMLRRLGVLIDPNKKRKPIRGPNPVLAKERRTSNLRSARWMIRIFYGSLFGSLGLAIMALYSGTQHPDLLRYAVQVLVAFQFALIGLVVPSLTSAAISGEVEAGTFEMLRLAPLSGGKVFWGKLIPAGLPALLPLLALLPAFGAMCLVDAGYVVRFLHMLPVAAMAVAFCSIVGLACSAFAANTPRATVAAYVATTCLFVLPALGWWAGDVHLSMSTARWVGFASPVVIALGLFAPAVSEVSRLHTEHLWLMGGLCLALLVAARIRLALLLRQG